MARTRLIAAMILTYVAFAMLLNSVGTVILQSISSFHVTKPEASTLEGFKDITIAIVSFLTASYLPRIGLRNALIGRCCSRSRRVRSCRSREALARRNCISRWSARPSRSPKSSSIR